MLIIPFVLTYFVGCLNMKSIFYITDYKRVIMWHSKKYTNTVTWNITNYMQNLIYSTAVLTYGYPFRVQWLIISIQATQKTEARGSLESRCSGTDWETQTFSPKQNKAGHISVHL